MKALYFDGKEVIYKSDYREPVPTPGHALIRTELAAICNTDKEVIRGYRPDFSGVLGHEFVGIVEDCDDPAWIGKRVVGELNEGCGHCIYCRTNREKHCLTRKVIGMDGLDGTFAEYFVLANHLLHEVPESLPTEVAIFTEPLAAALEIPNEVHIRPDDNIAIIGDGRLALMICEALSLSGADVTVIGHHEDKLQKFAPYAKTRLEASLNLDPTDITDTFEVVVDACGAPSGMELAKKIIRKRGRIVLKSTYAGETSIDMSYFAVNEVTITGSRCGPFEPALKLLEKKLVELPAIDLYRVEDYKAALASTAFKVGFDFRR